MKKRYWLLLGALVVLVITYLAGPRPPEPTYATDWPVLPTDLRALTDTIDRREAALPIRPDNDARARWYRDTAVTEYSFVYLHGFAGSYRDGYPLNVLLADTFGANIYLARWAGHGLRPDAAMREFDAEAAWASAREALAVGRRIGRKVILVSTSTGGTLALLLAATYPDSVHALINMGPNIRDDQPGAPLLNTPWGYELAQLVSLGRYREIERSPAEARYWDTRYPAQALVDLQVLVGSSMIPATFGAVRCPVLTMYYRKNTLQEDQHVEVDIYPKVHAQLGTPPAQRQLTALPTPETHFIGSDIMSEDYRTPLDTAIRFCHDVVGMKSAPPGGPQQPTQRGER